MADNEPTLLCMELYGNATVDKRLISDEKGAESYIRERISHYTDRDYPIPDSKLIVMRFADRTKLSDNATFDGYQFIEICKNIWPMLHDTLGVRVPFEGKLQLAAYCLAKGMEPTYGAMQREFFTVGFSEFHARQSTRIGMFADSFQQNIPLHKRPDDWSFTLGMTSRTFSEEERKDILALGCILSNGMERYMLTPASFPSFDNILVTPSFVQHVSEGKPMPVEEFRKQSMEIKIQASEILTRLYPQIAPAIKDLSGVATGTPGNEVYGLIGGSGVPNFVSDNHNPVTEDNPQLGFMDFMKFYCQSDILKDSPNLSRYRFMRLRGEGMNYRSSQMPLNGDYSQHWYLFLQKARKLGIKPMNEVSYIDASYCLANGRNPLHPANIHRNLLMEKEYARFLQQKENRLDERHMKPQKQRADSKAMAGRRLPGSQTKKRGPSL